jgi:hypothetical protein
VPGGTSWTPLPPTPNNRIKKNMFQCVGQCPQNDLCPFTCETEILFSCVISVCFLTFADFIKPDVIVLISNECVGVLISLWLFLFAAQLKEFVLDGLKKLEQRSHKCVELRGEYVELIHYFNPVVC